MDGNVGVEIGVDMGGEEDADVDGEEVQGDNEKEDINMAMGVDMDGGGDIDKDMVMGINRGCG